jgi:mycoredoxin
MSEVLQASSAPAGAITMYATRWCGDCQSYRRWFDARHISYDVIDIDRDEEAAAYVIQVNGGMRSVPTIVFPDGSVLVEPTSCELAARCFHIREQPEKGEAKSETMTMSKHGRLSPGTKEISSPRFAAFYNWMMGRPLVRRMFDPLRRETAGQAYGIVLEVGAGGGQNFPLYDPARVVRVEAVEPDKAMLVEARRSLSAAPVPITLTCVPVESLPFPEHVRAQGKITAGIQGALVPVTTRCMGHCHWNRDTLRTVLHTGFQTTQVRQLSGGLQPLLLIHARRLQTQEEMKARKEYNRSARREQQR